MDRPEPVARRKIAVLLVVVLLVAVLLVAVLGPDVSVPLQPGRLRAQRRSSRAAGASGRPVENRCRSERSRYASFSWSFKPSKFSEEQGELGKINFNSLQNAINTAGIQLI
jgi:hypothetical protein